MEKMDEVIEFYNVGDEKCRLEKGLGAKKALKLKSTSQLKEYLCLTSGKLTISQLFKRQERVYGK
jgi:hypothetical protein